jgi:hypothetical protein
MPPQGLSPGDRVVELAALTVSAAVATGAVAGAWIVWLIKKSWLGSAGSLIAGAVVGVRCRSAGRALPLPHRRREYETCEGWERVIVSHYSRRLGRRHRHSHCCRPSRLTGFQRQESCIVSVWSCYWLWRRSRRIVRLLGVADMRFEMRHWRSNEAAAGNAGIAIGHHWPASVSRSLCQRMSTEFATAFDGVLSGRRPRLRVAHPVGVVIFFPPLFRYN